jgi:hypothetical protein
MKTFKVFLLVFVSSLITINVASATPMIAGNNGNNNMYAVDVNAMTGVLIGNSTINIGFGGLGFSQDGTLFGWTTVTNSLYTVNLGTGAWGLVGGGAPLCGDTFEIRPTDNTAVVFDICNYDIYTVNLADGSTAFRVSASNLDPASAFSSDGTLYQIPVDGANLQTVDIDTGAVVNVGATGINATTITSLGFNPDDGMLYSLGVFNANLYRFDPSTGSGVNLGVVAGLPITEQYTMATFDATAIEVAIDIKFCSDPNAFNCKKKGVLPVTIFGTEDFDVEGIDISSLQLCTEDLLNCTNAPIDWSVADRGDPEFDLGAAMCAVVEVEEGIFEEQDYLTQDGFLDLDAAFEASEVQDMLGTFCSDVKGATSEPLVITGTTLDGATIFSVPLPNLGTDQLWKVNK